MMQTPLIDNMGMRRRRQAQQGQTIVVALLVLLLLGFIGGLFSSIVTRNLSNAARSNRIQTADYYAESGIRFADDQMTHNPDGADWRPPLQFLITNTAFQPNDGLGSLRYNQAKLALTTVNVNDPDRQFLEQGFTRYNIGTGRFLLRLTYDPVGATTTAVSDPRARYIKIESVGREGVVDPTDPTTFINQPPTRLASTLVEYKAIGLTDYARFETNPDKRSDIMALGSASEQYVTDFDESAANPYSGLRTYYLVTTYGAPDAYTLAGTGAPLLPNPSPTAGSNLATSLTTQPGGGGIHVNGSARFYGLNYFYLNNTGGNTGSYNETLEVAGDLLIDNYDPTVTNPASAVEVITPPTPALAPGLAYKPQIATPTNATTFDTLGGAVRDGSSGTDAAGNARNSNRLEPPLLESMNPATNLPRYKDVTINSPARQGVPVDPATNNPPLAAGASGYGQAIYVNNSSDVQSDSTSLVGGYTLVDEWLHRAPPGIGRHSWSASYYRPPGVEIVLGRQNDGTKTFYGVRLTRSDVDAAGKPVLWKDKTLSADLGSTMFVAYSDMNASHALDPNQLNAAAPNTLDAYQSNPNNDVIIYAEGNVRVRGTVSAPAGATATNETSSTDVLPRHVTIVTNGTAYIEGSLLRGNPESSISVLAHDYVCVNTTLFLAGAQVDENPLGTRPPVPASGDPGFNALDFSASDEALLEELQYIPASTINTTSAAPLALYVSGGPGAPGDTSADFDLVNAATGFSLVPPAGTNALFGSPVQEPFTSTQSTFSTAGLQVNGLTHQTFPLTNTTLPQFDPVQFAVRRSPTPTVLSNNVPIITATQDFLLERAAILPADIRIEAVLFAENRSFFVIPGDWFNTDTSDNLAAFNDTAQGNSISRPGIDNTNNDQKRFPFFGQPVDMKIIIDGSVSEARPADIAAQTAWMEKWGWIPLYHGNALDTSTNKPELANRNSPRNPGQVSKNPGVGLTLIYNPQGGYPYAPAAVGTVNALHYLRTDLYGRPLPYTPKLPVCTGLLYSGQNASDQPILQ